MKNYRLWTTLEIKLVEMGIIPSTRSIDACKVFCRRNGVNFPGKRQCDANDKLIDEIEKKFSTKGHNMKKDTKKKKNDDFGEFRNIYMADIIENDENPRTEIGSVEDLKASIKAQGLLQPIVVRRIDNGFKVVAGSRRFKACKELKMGAVPCIIIDADNDTAYQLATAENIVRENMTAVDEANAVAKLFAQGKSRTEIGAMFGKSARWAEGRRRIVELGDKAMDYLAAGKINLGHAEVLTMCDPKDVNNYLENARWETPEALKNRIMNQKPLLERAPFNAKTACKNCEKRSDCQRDLFDDVQNAYCLDRECFSGKVKKEAERIRKKYIADGFEEVPADKKYDAIHGWSGWYDADTEDESERNIIAKLAEDGAQPMFWIDEDTAEHSLVWCDKSLAFDDEEDADEEAEETPVDKDSFAYKFSRLDYEKRNKVKEDASKEEMRIVADKMKAVFGNIRNETKAFILSAMDISFEDEEGNERSYLTAYYKASEDFLEKIAEKLTVENYYGLDDDIREYFEMDSRETFEQNAYEAMVDENEQEESEND